VKLLLGRSSVGEAISDSGGSRSPPRSILKNRGGGKRQVAIWSSSARGGSGGSGGSGGGGRKAKGRNLSDFYDAVDDDDEYIHSGSGGGIAANVNVNEFGIDHQETDLSISLNESLGIGKTLDKQLEQTLRGNPKLNLYGSGSGSGRGGGNSRERKESEDVGDKSLDIAAAMRADNILLSNALRNFLDESKDNSINMSLDLDLSIDDNDDSDNDDKNNSDDDDKHQKENVGAEDGGEEKDRITLI